MPRADKLSPGAVKLLKEKQIANFATLMADGSPQVTPVWIDAEDDGSYVIVNTATGRIKTNNIDRDPRVALSIVDSADPFRTVVIRGVIESTRSAAEGANAHIDRMAKKYLGQDVYPGHNDKEERVMLMIKPQNIIERGV